MIVPVYGVERYLRECLDSILAGGHPVEVVAVDDASPDGSADILAEYAAFDPRVRVITHDVNRGLGAARNTGLDHARGEYVWFVDSDDWLTAGALDAVLERLARTSPDVLVVGYERSYWDGRVTPEPAVPPGPPLPDVFTVREHPRLLKGLHIACNKIVRRSYLVDLGVRFAPGWYEDVSFSHPILLSARRASVLERVCYEYRQRPEGAITGTRTERHFEVFDHWHRAFDLLDARGFADDELRPLLFQRMIWHYLGVLNHPSRVHRDRRRAFFASIVRDYRRYRPAGGYPRPGGIANVTFALVAINAFRLFETLRAVYRARSLVSAGVSTAHQAINRSYYWVQRRLPLSDTVAVYADGTHEGYPHSPYARDVSAIVDAARALVPDARRMLVVGPPRAATRRVLRGLARSRLVVSDVDLPPSVIRRPRQQVTRVRLEPVAVPSPRSPSPAPSAHAG